MEPSAEMQQYYDWARANGVEWSKVHYPAVFPPGYEGTVATEEIGPYETVVKVPSRMVLSYKLAANSDLKPIFDQHPEVFSELHYEHEDMVLSAYLISEQAKGPSSFWHPFIQVLPQTVEVLYDWESSELKQLQDPDLRYDADSRYTHILDLWREWQGALKEHSEFTEDMLSIKSFHWAWKLLMTRCFGKYSPSTSFGPVAELLNHSNSKTVYIYGEDSAQDLRSFQHFGEDEDQDDLSYEPEEFIALSCKHLLTLLGCAVQLNDHMLESLRVDANGLDYVDADSSKVYSALQKHKELNKTVDVQDSPSAFIRIRTGDEVYRAGSQVFLNYGRYSNRQLLSYYGFLLPYNKFDYARLKVKVSRLTLSQELQQKVIENELDCFVMFKVKATTICLGKH
jgi:hypothetical protein